MVPGAKDSSDKGVPGWCLDSAWMKAHDILACQQVVNAVGDKVTGA
jgi:hypothetical protein